MTKIIIKPRPEDLGMYAADQGYQAPGSVSPQLSDLEIARQGQNAMMPTFTTESMFDYGRSYLSDVNNVRGLNQPAYAKLGAGVVSMATRAATSFAEGVVNPIYGLGALAYEGARSLSQGDDFHGSVFYDNNFTQLLDKANNYMKEVAPVYYSNADKNAGFFEQFGTSAFWADSVLGNLGFTVGTIASAVTLGAGISKLGMGLAKLNGEAARSGEFIAKLSKMTPEEFATASKSLTGIADEAASMKALQTALTQQKYMDNGMNMLASITEAGVEAREGKTGFIKDQVDKYKATHEGQEPDYFTMKKIEDMANTVGNARFGMNVALLMGTNYVQFNRLFKAATRPSGMGSMVFPDLSDALETVIDKNTGKRITELTKEQLAKASFGSEDVKKLAMIGATLKRPLAEGFEEGMQTVFDKGTAEYGNQRMNEEDRATAFVKGITKGFEESLGTKEGLTSIVVGALTGSLPIQGVSSKAMSKWTKQKDAKWLSGGLFEGKEEIAKKREEAEQIINFMNDDKASYDKMQTLYQSMSKSSQNGNDYVKAVLDRDIQKQQNSELNEIINQVQTATKLGVYDLWRNRVEGLQEEANKTGNATNQEFLNSMLQVADKTNKYASYVEGKFGALEDIYKSFLLESMVKGHIAEKYMPADYNATREVNQKSYLDSLSQYTDTFKGYSANFENLKSRLESLSLVDTQANKNLMTAVDDIGKVIDTYHTVADNEDFDLASKRINTTIQQADALKTLITDNLTAAQQDDANDITQDKVDGINSIVDFLSSMSGTAHSELKLRTDEHEAVKHLQENAPFTIYADQKRAAFNLLGKSDNLAEAQHSLRIFDAYLSNQKESGRFTDFFDAVDKFNAEKNAAKNKATDVNEAAADNITKVADHVEAKEDKLITNKRQQLFEAQARLVELESDPLADPLAIEQARDAVNQIEQEVNDLTNNKPIKVEQTIKAQLQANTPLAPSTTSNSNVITSDFADFMQINLFLTSSNNQTTITEAADWFIEQYQNAKRRDRSKHDFFVDFNQWSRAASPEMIDLSAPYIQQISMGMLNLNNPKVFEAFKTISLGLKDVAESSTKIASGRALIEDALTTLNKEFNDLSHSLELSIHDLYDLSQEVFINPEANKRIEEVDRKVIELQNQLTQQQVSSYLDKLNLAVKLIVNNLTTLNMITPNADEEQAFKEYTRILQMLEQGAYKDTLRNLYPQVALLLGKALYDGKGFAFVDTLTVNNFNIPELHSSAKDLEVAAQSGGNYVDLNKDEHYVSPAELDRSVPENNSVLANELAWHLDLDKPGFNSSELTNEARSTMTENEIQSYLLRGTGNVPDNYKEIMLGNCVNTGDKVYFAVITPQNQSQYVTIPENGNILHPSALSTFVNNKRDSKKFKDFVEESTIGVFVESNGVVKHRGYLHKVSTAEELRRRRLEGASTEEHEQINVEMDTVVAYRSQLREVIVSNYMSGELNDGGWHAESRISGKVTKTKQTLNKNKVAVYTPFGSSIGSFSDLDIAPVFGIISSDLQSNIPIGFKDERGNIQSIEDHLKLNSAKLDKLSGRIRNIATIKPRIINQEFTEHKHDRKTSNGKVVTHIKVGESTINGVLYDDYQLIDTINNTLSFDDSSTILQAIQASLTDNAEVITSLTRLNPNFNIATVAGLHAFIKQFMWINSTSGRERPRDFFGTTTFNEPLIYIIPGKSSVGYTIDIIDNKNNVMVIAHKTAEGLTFEKLNLISSTGTRKFDSKTITIQEFLAVTQKALAGRYYRTDMTTVNPDTISGQVEQVVFENKIPVKKNISAYKLLQSRLSSKVSLVKRDYKGTTFLSAHLQPTITFSDITLTKRNKNIKQTTPKVVTPPPIVGTRTIAGSIPDLPAYLVDQESDIDFSLQHEYNPNTDVESLIRKGEIKFINTETKKEC